MVQSKDIAFFIFVGSLFFVLSKIANISTSQWHINQDVSLILTSIVFTIILILVGWMSNIRDDFTFEVTPAKRCAGGPYMYSSNPELQKLCKNISPDEIAQYSCNPGFIGAPVHWNRTSMSDSHWENKMCDELSSVGPTVL